MMPIVAFALVLIFPALVVVAALRDAVSYTIPNWISLALIVAFPVAALAAGVPFGVIGLNFGVGAVALIAGMVMFALRWIGGGDAKLFAAAALWIGWPAGLEYLAVTGIAGGALTMGLLILRKPMLRAYVVNGPAWFTRLAEPGESVPYGVAIAVGALAAFPSCAVMAALMTGA